MEVCVDSVQSALNARDGGAARLELCTGLAEGGLTPSLGLLRQVRDLTHPLPVNVLIRPRAGDFCYSTDDLKVMQNDIKIFKEENVAGFVLGVLTPEGHVDKTACRSLLNDCRPLPVTFHRAFDWTVDAIQALDDLMELGIQRLLTSGQKQTALLGAKLLKDLVDRARGRIVIMPGGGITEDNLVEILETTGAKEFHGSANQYTESQMAERKSVTMGTGGCDFRWKQTSTDSVRRMVVLANTALKGSSNT